MFAPTPPRANFSSQLIRALRLRPGAVVVVEDNDLARLWASGVDRPERPCTYSEQPRAVLERAAVLVHPLVDPTTPPATSR
jgi:hypothetical protein